MSNDTQVLRATLETALARIKDMLADDDGQAFKEARKFLESARQLAEQGAPVAAQQRFRHPQKGTPGWSVWQPCEVRNRPAWEIDSQGYEVEYRALCVLAARPLTASPTAPSTEASEPVGEREAFIATAKRAGFKGVYLGDESSGKPDKFVHRMHEDMFAGWELARTTPPPAPVLSDAERLDWLETADWAMVQDQLQLWFDLPTCWKPATVRAAIDAAIRATKGGKL